jgi:hypothetical protein
MNSVRLFKGFFIALLFTAILSARADDVHVEIDSEGWTLVGDLTTPDTMPPNAFALLLHKAAGDRKAYVTMAEAMAARGIASLTVTVTIWAPSTPSSADTWITMIPPSYETLH